ncbi:MAG: HEAT repeat domain-containing protein, partial [Planctomycetes bacterium]|nr:HEAT repeat domain-containing protein [Planctomycetota bacterium]
VEPLLEALARSTESEPRFDIIYALGEIGDARAVQPLVSVLKADSKLGSHAADALAKVGDRRAVDPLIRALKEDDERRYRAAAALAEIGDPRAIEPLLQALHDAGTHRRYIIATALIRIGDERLVEPFAESLQRSEPGYESIAIGFLGERGDLRALEPAVERLREVNRKDNVSTLLSGDLAAYTMAAIAIRHGADRIRHLVSDPHRRVRAAAAQAMAEVAKKRYELLLDGPRRSNSVKPSSRAGSDLLAEIRSAGSRARSGDQQALQRLKTGLKSPVVDLQIAAIAELARSQQSQPEIVTDLKQALAEASSPTVKLKITGELAKAQDLNALKNLRQYLKSEDPVERIYAGQILGQEGPQGVAKELVAALEDDDTLARVNAATAIIRILSAQAAADRGAESSADVHQDDAE